LVLEDESWRAAFRAPILEDEGMGGVPMDMIEVEVDALLEEDVRAMLSEEEEKFNPGRLLPPLRPLAYKVSTKSLQRKRLPFPVYPRPMGIYTNLSLCYSSSSPSTEPSLDELIQWTALAQARYGQAPRLRLESFPSSLLSELESWIGEPNTHSEISWNS